MHWSDGILLRGDLVAGPTVNVVDVLLLALSVAVFGYLGYAMIKPEKF
jgi:K+-transporting ATPase KdpF subunit